MDREEMQLMLAELWKRHLPEIVGRVEVLERACAALQSGSFAEEDREAAVSAAHKLAGALGTFGRERGTELAREVERWLQTREGALQHGAEIRSALAELKAVVERGPAGA